MPIKWLKFEQSLNQLVEDGARFTSLDQVRLYLLIQYRKACDEFVFLYQLLSFPSL